MVMQCAKALGEALVQSEQYKEYIIARAEVDNDLASSNLLTAYAEKEEEIASAMMKADTEDGGVDMNAVSAELQMLREKITANERITRLADAQGDFNALMQGVNEIISHYINPEEEESGCTGNCSSCGGCH